MSYGFLATNASGQVLISSQTRNLHFVGKASFWYTIKSFDGYGGLRHWAYIINCNVTPMPFFTMPTGDHYAVVSVARVSGTAWKIEVIRSGTSGGYPDVYVFADPRGATATPGTNYGMQVLQNDGTPAFDSRRQPLVVTGGVSVFPPANPSAPSAAGLTARYCGSNASGNLAPQYGNTFGVSIPGAKPVYFYPSIAQSQREILVSETERDCTGFSPYGICIGFEDKYFYNSRYWCFYRGGIRRSGSSIVCGWIAADYGCNWDYREKEKFLGIGIGSSSGSGGSWPYSNETLNLQATPVIIADGATYD